MLVIETEGTDSGNSWDMRRASLENKARLDSASFPLLESAVRGIKRFILYEQYVLFGLLSDEG